MHHKYSSTPSKKSVPLRQKKISIPLLPYPHMIVNYPPSSFHTHHNYLQAIIVMQLAIQPAIYKQKLSQRENFHFYSAAAFKWWLMWKLYLILNTISICVFNLSFTNKKSNWWKSSKQIKDYGHNGIMKRQLPILFIVLKRLVVVICFERKPFLLLVAYYNLRVGKLFLQRLVV